MKSLQLITTILCLTLFVSCKNQENKSTAQLPSYPVVEVDQKDINTYYIMPANIAGINNNQVRPKISGYIKEVLVDEGQRVKKGNCFLN